MMAARNVEWVTSQKRKAKLIVDDYVFASNGKGKAVGVRYWICSTNGCTVNAKTSGNQLDEIHGLVNPGDHGHVNDTAKISEMKLTVKTVHFTLSLFKIENKKICRLHFSVELSHCIGQALLHFIDPIGL